MPLILSERKPWIVQKYGGTSLGKLLSTITSTIIPGYLQNSNIAVVCSAISGTSKSQGTTGLLFQAIEYALHPQKGQYGLNATIDAIRDNHLDLGRTLRLGADDGSRLELGKVFTELEHGIVEDCESLRVFLVAAQTIGELSGRSKDRVIAVGEKLACRVVVSSLARQGITAKLVILEDLVDKGYSGDKHRQVEAYDTLGPRFFDVLATEIGRRLEDCGESVPVVTGFFGMMPGSLIRSVGRGYSDLCAAMCAAGISASELQIWKEVDGIFTADPRKIPSARLLPTVTLEEASELTYYGSEVIHPFTMEQIRTANIPLRIKNVKNPDGNGTIVYPSQSGGTTTPESNSDPERSVSDLSISTFMRANGYYGVSQNRRTPTALTTKDSIVLINIQSNRQKKSHGFLAQVFHKLDVMKAVADLITSSEQLVSLAISSFDEPEKTTRLIAELEKCGKVEVFSDMAIVSVIGHKMRNMVGIAGQIFSKLATGGVNIYLIGQGASEINISLVIQKQDTLMAMNIIHADVLGIPKHTAHIPIVQNSLMKGPWLF
ncbi:aspartate kinase [Amylocarpus encephaloides]|uniref:Aspartokinase n=1 Tax=Amylocarpus encephaloides TaxID=45428 RepID=A0A9P8C7K3_9HELO|nr:aspartate kinase [Amylocarpus encephaloides]